MAISSQGPTFTFTGIGGIGGSVTSISIEEAQPEIVDLTGVSDGIGTRRRVWTGDITSPAKVSIEYLRSAVDLAAFEPLSATGASGSLTISCPAFTVGVVASVESASTEISVGDAVRGRMTFIVDKKM